MSVPLQKKTDDKAVWAQKCIRIKNKMKPN